MAVITRQIARPRLTNFPTPSQQDRILQSLRAGLPMSRAARSAGLAPARLRGWLSRAENVLALSKGEYDTLCKREPRVRVLCEFALLVWEVETEIETSRVSRLEQSSDWKAQAYLLERSHPEAYDQKHSRDAGIAAQLAELQNARREASAGRITMDQLRDATPEQLRRMLAAKHDLKALEEERGKPGVQPGGDRLLEDGAGGGG